MEAAELAVLDLIQRYMRYEVLDRVLTAVTHLADRGQVWIILAVVLLFLRRERRCGASVACALLLDLITCNLLLKPLVGRIRPFVVNPTVELLVRAPQDASFPSGHTAVSFAAVMALKESGSPLWKPALVLAVLIAFSRLYLYVHWPSDVLGGILLGIAVGWVGARLVRLAAPNR